MTRRVRLEDTALEAMLARRGIRILPVGLSDGILAAIAEAPQARRPLVPWPGLFTEPVPAFGPARVVVVAGLLLALVVSLVLVGSRWLEILPQPPHRGAVLVPTGIDVLTPDTGAYRRMVADGDGILWARGESGRLVRLDPASESAQTWTVADDAVFVSADIAPARDGGVWLIGERALRRFDGAVFREVLDAPTDMVTAVEAPDGTLWAATADGAALHWDGSSWSRLDAGRPNPNSVMSSIAVDAAGRLWIGWTQYPWPSGSGWVSLYDGSAWTIFDADDAGALGMPVREIAELPDRTVWVATAGGLARFDGSTWTDVAGCDTWSVAATPDGALWFASYDLSMGGTMVSQFDGQSWTSYGPSDGLPGPDESGSEAASVVPTKDGVYVATGAGIYRLAGSRWARVWPVAQAPAGLGRLLAVSHDEIWAVFSSGPWHFSKGAWTLEPVDPRYPRGHVNDLALAPDGTVWAAGTDGVSYRRDGRWVVADATRANAIYVGDDGTVWAAGLGGATVGVEVWMLRFDGTQWVRGPVASCPLSGVASLAIDSSGEVWAGGTDGVAAGGLARFDGQSWKVVREVAGSEVRNVVVFGTASGGDIWVEVESPESTRQIVRFDGTIWTATEEPAGARAIDLAADGTVWVSTDRGPAVLDGERWVLPHANVQVRTTGAISVAPDGTVFAAGSSNIWRFPSQWGSQDDADKQAPPEAQVPADRARNEVSRAPRRRECPMARAMALRTLSDRSPIDLSIAASRFPRIVPW